LVTTSIMDASNIPIKASIVARSPVQPFGSSRFGREVGAISECGIRDSNEDAYLIANDLNEVFTSVDGISETVFQPGSGGASLFAIFDGHSGNQAARFAAEKLTEYLKGQVRSRQRLDRENISSTLRDALIDLDNSFCQLCHEEGRHDRSCGCFDGEFTYNCQSG
jgi:serine/threonine protein phosphatase PrpC